MLSLPTGPILTAQEMRVAEEHCVAAGTSLSTLMDRAGAAVAEAAWRYGAGRPGLILCGPGNNGGDGYVAARLLRERGVQVSVAALGDPATELARAARGLWNGAVESLAEAAAKPVLVDALFGTGLKRPLSEDVQAQLARLKASAELTIAVDLPSGLETDSGVALGAMASDLTIALGTLKPAQLLQPGASLCGAVRLADIGVVAQSSFTVLEKPRLSEPGADSHKYRRGYAVIIGGAMAGAAMLSAKAAMRLAGYVAICGARMRGPDALVHRRWDDLAKDARVGALLIGPGLGRDEVARGKLDQALASPHPLVLDADALMLADAGALARLDRPVILTPHEGEFAQLFGDLPGSKVERARAAAAQSRSALILKGSDTVIAAPDGRARIATAAPGWLASAGTGDVLAGIVAALLSSGMDAFDAACAGVWLHNEAARLCGPALIADDLPPALPSALASCL